ncbi:MAG TPA: FGGY-family carbohydrate kinase [Feifaniaceae bacterium]|nr:FGGY-family carbohydrate kinase [Feifaniaceae bacterium]
MEKIIAYDLGTGGIKASLFTAEGLSLADAFMQYDAVYKPGGVHEQKPELWWEGIVASTRLLLQKSGANASDIAGLSISGHSLGVVPVDRNGKLLRDYTPIWSDTRAASQAQAFFEKIPYETWYRTTGNGFPAECYAVFKIMWYRDNEPELYKNAYKILGSKDYCNLKLTGRMCTDHSYASGSGVYDLKAHAYVDAFIEAAGVRKELFPELLQSHEVVGTLTPEAANALGLCENVRVVAGGVDNSCMALGAKGVKNGRAYLSLGSSSWIAAVGDKPLLDFQYKPFVFAHVIDGLYASATSIFAAGSSFRWARDTLCPDLVEKERAGELADAYDEMNRLAALSPIGANGVQFNPSLAGGAMIEETKNIRGGFLGLSLEHDRSDMIRASMEGIAYNLYYAMTILEKYQDKLPELLLVGGGGKSPFWRQMFADIFDMDIVKTNIGQNAASLGAAALAAYGLGYWDSYDRIDRVHQVRDIARPDPERVRAYRPYYERSRHAAHLLALYGDTFGAMG